MSSKTKTNAIKEDATPALVPKLRFPEFRGTKWVHKKLEDVAPLQRGFDLPSDLVRPGDIPIVYSNGIQKYHDVGMATAPGLVTGRSGTIGKLHFIERGEYWPHNTSLWVTDFKGNDPLFVYYLYGSIGMDRFSSGSGVPTLNRNDVHAFGTPIPNSTAEQQKIAECLSSVDELMAAQARKVDALKSQKKGLMQQLFPRKGETQPRLRFPEFQNAREWDEGTVEELIATVTPPIKLQTADYQSEGEFPIVDQSQDYICGWTNDGAAVIDEGLPVIVFGDHTCTLKFIERPFAQGADGIKIFRPKRGIDIRFLFCALQADPVAQESYKRHFSILKEKKLFYPDPKSGEQRRIATCLSSLDALISAETQKLEALKTHKKGLMQQIFPSLAAAA